MTLMTIALAYALFTVSWNRKFSSSVMYRFLYLCGDKKKLNFYVTKVPFPTSLIIEGKRGDRAWRQNCKNTEHGS